jgi:hypothetical protein
MYMMNSRGDTRMAHITKRGYTDQGFGRTDLQQIRSRVVTRTDGAHHQKGARQGSDVRCRYELATAHWAWLCMVHTRRDHVAEKKI